MKNQSSYQSMMLVLLIYCYATGRFSSRQIEAATYSDVVVRYICGGDLHPDHDTICTFRRDNGVLFSECFVKVLSLASELGCLKKVGIEWDIVTMAYNFKRLFKMTEGTLQSGNGLLRAVKV